MVSRNNVKERLVTDTDRVSHYGIRKLSVGVASVLLGTTLYLGSGAVVHADTVNADGQGSTPKEEIKANVDTHEVDVTSNTAITNKSTIPATPNGAVTPASTTEMIPTGTENKSLVNNLSKSTTEGSNNVIPANSDTGNVNSVTETIPAGTENKSLANNLSKSTTDNSDAAITANSDTGSVNSATERRRLMMSTGTRDNNLTTSNQPTAMTTQTTEVTRTIHWRDRANQMALLPDSVISVQYQRKVSSDQTTSTSWEYVAGSIKVTGTPITVKLGSEQRNVPKTDEHTHQSIQVDRFNLVVNPPSIPVKQQGETNNITYRPEETGILILSNLLNTSPSVIVNPQTTEENTVYYDKKVHIAIKVVDDDRNGEAVDVPYGDSRYSDLAEGDYGTTVAIPVLDGYELAPGQATNITYNDNTPNEITIHLKHRIEKRQIKVDVKGTIMNLVRIVNGQNLGILDFWANPDSDHGSLFVLISDPHDSGSSNPYGSPIVDLGTLVGTVQYDLATQQIVNKDEAEGTLTPTLPSADWGLLKIDQVLDLYMIDSDIEDDIENHKLRNVLQKHTGQTNYQAYLSGTLTDGAVAYQNGLNGYAKLTAPHFTNLQNENGEEVATSEDFTLSPIALKDLVEQINSENGGLDSTDNSNLEGTTFVTVPFVWGLRQASIRAVTRTIVVTKPDSTQDTIKQTAQIGATGAFNKFPYSYKTNVQWDQINQYVSANNWTEYTPPVVSGYTPSQASVAAEVVTPDTKDTEVTVTYSADRQKMAIDYIDDTTGQTLNTQSLTGLSDESANYNTKSAIDNYKSQGYDLVSDNTNGANLVFDHDTGVDQHYEVHLKHHLENVSRTSKVNETINYVYAKDHSPVKPAYHANAITFVQNGVSDAVTKQTAWSPVASQQFASVTSPQIDGYTADQLSIPVIMVNFGDTDIVRTVIYSPDIQNLDVAFIDDTTGETLKTIKKSGPSDTSTDYNTKNDIDGYKAQHYNVVSDSTNGQNLVFDHDDSKDQHYEVHLSHATHSINEAHDVSQVIHYVYQNGSKAADDHTNHVHFARDGYRDEVTNTDHWNAWTPSETYKFDAVPTPVKTGYTPDVQTVPVQTVTPASNDIRKVVTYTPDAQKLNVKFIDDTTGQVLKTVAKTGVTNANAGYNTQSDIQSYEGQHYVLVSDSSNGANLVFDNNDSVDQAYDVHLKHGTHQIDEHHTITQTVHYIATDHASVPDDHTVSVQFDRDGYHDEVTGDDHWNAWKQGDTQTLAEVPTPKKAGYTPDKSSVPATVVYPSDHNQTITVTYTPDTQKVIVIFIDDTDNGKTLKTVTKTGPTNSNAGYTTDDDISTYKGQHYVLVSDQTHGQSITFDTDTNADQCYDVHLKHGTHQINDHRTITETVHYKMTDGTTAPADHTAKIEFSRDGFNDEVTGADHWNAWKQGSTQTFNAVQSPAVKGYTPDTDQINAVTVNPDSQSIERTVTYTPDAQKLDVTFIDDTIGETLKTVVKNGVTNADAKYNTKSDIQDFESQHYVLVSDSSNGAELVFDNDDAVDQHYEVHLKHATHAIDEHHTINETVHYKMSDGTKAPDDYHAEALSFSRDGFNDEVTGIDHWNAWVPKAEQTFGKVASPLVAGYTPDIDQINTQTVKPIDHDLEFTVTYTPNVQIVHVKYIDDTDHKVLTQDDLNGRTGETSGYHTTDRITEFKGQHYVFVSDNYPATGMTFDNNDRFDQIYEVHFKHGTRTDEQDVQVPRTIKYVYQNGQQAQPDHTDALSFHETKVVDLVDGHTVSDDWTPAQDFETVMTPAIQGYTPDHASVSNTGIAHDHSAIVETVTYNPDAQKAVVKYIDDTTGEQLEAKDLAGVSDQSTGYTTNETIDGYINQHYVLVSDGTHGETVVFDHDDDADQSYDVHLKHGTEPANESRIKKIAVHYQYADGLARSGKAHDDQTAPELTFNRTGMQDLVTNEIDWNAWDHIDQSFSPIDSPAIQGYTPDRTIVDNIKVNSDAHDSTEVTVTYHADAQKLTVNFIDDVTGQTLNTVTKTGYSDEAADYNTKADVQNFIGQHYDLVSNATNSADLVFDHNGDVDQVYDVHLTHHLTPISDHQVVNETIHYVYADGLARTGKAADDYTATPLEFNRTGKHDDVTGTDSWNAWIPGSASFATVQSPVIQGYTPDQAQVDAVSVDANSQDIVKTVTYSADPQKMTVDFIDDTDNGKVLKTVTKTGGSDEAVGYNTKADIQTFVDGHYKLDHDTSNGENLVFDHDDAVDQHYEVHLTHETAPITEATSTNQVIHYQLSDGTQVAKDYTAKLDFSRNGFKDLVTNADHWNAWTPNATQTFDVVVSPAKVGYTPDHKQIDAVTVEPHYADLETTVTYSPNAQKASVKYIDDVTGKILDTEAASGNFGTKIEFMDDPLSMIQKFEDQGYKLVSNSFTGQDYQADNSKNQFEVHFKHGEKNVSQESTITRTIKYVDQKTGKEIHQPVVQTLTFTENGVMDLVTGKITWNTPSEQQFTKAESPMIDGYENPNISVVDAETAKFGDGDQTVIVKYQKVETPSTSYTPKTTSHSKTSNCLNTSVTTTNTISKATQSAQTASQNISIRTSQTSTPQTTNDVHESQLPQTGNKTNSKLELLGLISIAFAGLTGLFGFGTRRKKHD